MTNDKFTPAELQTIHNKKFFLVKRSASEKIEHLFTGVRDEIKEVIKKERIIFPEEVDSQIGKIFRGENYLGLPYLVLDYPKHFSKESVFAFRTMFWWGNFFSFTLHLQGKALEDQRSRLINNIPLLKKKDIYICMNKNPWQYHYNKENYLATDKFSAPELKQILFTKEFIKLSRKIPLKEHKKLVAFSRESFSILSSLFSSQ